MTEFTLPILITLLTATPFVVAYFVARAVARWRVGTALQAGRDWRGRELARVEREWLAPDWDPDRLPASLSLVAIAAEWAAADPAILADWRFGRMGKLAATPLPELLKALWEGTAPAARQRSEPLLREALAAQATAWSGAERGWTGRRYVLPAPPAKKADPQWRIEVVEDLTSAPAPGPLRAKLAAEEAEGWMLPLLISLQRAAPVRRIHPLQAPATGIPMLADIGGRAGAEMGSRVGASVGSILGPIGAALGRHLGGMLGGRGGTQLAGRVQGLQSGLEAVEEALTGLGDLAERGAFAAAARAPEEAWLARGTEWEGHRERRRLRLGERFWPGAGPALAEECMRLALQELRAYRASSPLFMGAVERAKPLARGGILLQNPWLAAALPGAPEAMTAARAALNRAARALRESE
jgi:hypothetical protein